MSKYSHDVLVTPMSLATFAQSRPCLITDRSNESKFLVASCPFSIFHCIKYYRDWTAITPLLWVTTTIFIPSIATFGFCGLSSGRRYTFSLSDIIFSEHADGDDEDGNGDGSRVGKWWDEGREMNSVQCCLKGHLRLQTQWPRYLSRACHLMREIPLEQSTTPPRKGSKRQVDT